MQGPAGPAGAPGPIGAPGISVTDAVIDNDLLLRLSTGETINAGRTRGDTGPGLDLELDSDGDIVDWLEVALGTDPNDGGTTDANDDGVPDDLAGGSGNGGGQSGVGGNNNVGGGLLSVVAGYNGTCGVRADGTQLGVCFGGSSGNFPTGGPIESFAMGAFNSRICAIRTVNTLDCGDNSLSEARPEGEFVAVTGATHQFLCRFEPTGR